METLEHELRESDRRTADLLKACDGYLLACAKRHEWCHRCRRKTRCQQHSDSFFAKHVFSISISESMGFKREHDEIEREGNPAFS